MNQSNKPTYAFSTFEKIALKSHFDFLKFRTRFCKPFNICFRVCFVFSFYFVQKFQDDDVDDYEAFDIQDDDPNFPKPPREQTKRRTRYIFKNLLRFRKFKIYFSKSWRRQIFKFQFWIIFVKHNSPYMTKYEKARILGTRALQISMNAPIMVRKKSFIFKSLQHDNKFLKCIKVFAS